jgi:flagellar basal body P-ring formation protein FlgA
MTRPMIAAALAAALTVPAGLAPCAALERSEASTAATVLARFVPTLKRSTVVNEPLVRIGDLVDNAGSLASIPVFRAPDVGATGTVSTAQVMEALRPYKMFSIDSDGISEIEVTRAGRIVAAADIKSRILQAYAGQYGLGEASALSLMVEREIRPFAVEATEKSDLVVMRSSYDPRTTRFDITFGMPGSVAARRVALRFTGTLVELVDAVVTTRGMQRGEVIKNTDVVIERRPKAEVPVDAAPISDKVAGLAVRQNLRPGQTIRRNDLMKPDLVRRDDTVTLIYEVPGLLLTTRGKSLEAGAEGDTITALNLQSKRTVQGVVTGPGQIKLVSHTPRVVAAAALAQPDPTRVTPKPGE